MPTLIVEPRVTYGTKRYYPLNDHAINLARLLGVKTYTKDQLGAVKRLGVYTIEISHEVEVF